MKSGTGLCHQRPRLFRVSAFPSLLSSLCPLAVISWSQDGSCSYGYHACDMSREKGGGAIE